MYRKNEKRQKPINHDIKTNMVETLHLPKDYVLGSAIVTITGNCELLVENYKGILEYEEFYIKLSTKIGLININGFNLTLEQVTEDDISIKGKIESVSIERTE